MRRIVMPGFKASPPPINSEVVRKPEPVVTPPEQKKKVKKSELKELVGAIINEAIPKPKKPRVKKPKIEEGTTESKLAEFKRMQWADINSWFSRRHLTWVNGAKVAGINSGHVLGSNGQRMGQFIIQQNGSMTVSLDPECFTDNHHLRQRLNWELGLPSTIKRQKQDKMLDAFCGAELGWKFDQIGQDGNFIGNFQRFSNGSLQINIIRGDEGRRGEYKYDCFKGIGD